MVADVECIPCEVGKEWQNGTAQPKCLPVSGCLPGSFIHNVATELSDRECRTCKNGVSFQDAFNASGCKAIAADRCPQSETIYEVAPTVSSDRQCLNHTVCEDGEEIGTPGTNISDAICVVKSVMEKKGSSGAHARQARHKGRNRTHNHNDQTTQRGSFWAPYTGGWPGQPSADLRA